MQTNFSLAQLADPAIADSEAILRKCVHCGFCTATCPTFVLLGDELDSPRGRIYLIKDMLENDRPADERTVRHIDRCLSCLSCVTTCPSGVDYMHLVDHAREHIKKTYKRPFFDAALRRLLALILPYPGRFRLAMLGAGLAKPLAPLFHGRLRAMLELAPKSIPAPSPIDRPGSVWPAQGVRIKRVALLNGCAQQVLDTDINEATVRLLNRHGVEVVSTKGVGCCGALTHHMGDTAASHAQARANIEAWMREIDGAGLDAIVINTSGCGTTVKDYGWMFKHDPAIAEKAQYISEITRDISELMHDIGLQSDGQRRALRVAYHSACSMQHGQQIKTQPKHLLKQAGFEVVEPAEGHLCCGSAGTYNLLQPEIASQLQRCKVNNLEATEPDVIATGNIGCMAQIAGATALPVVHTAMLLDWATGGPRPSRLPAS
ncbi:MAG: glycolate oxidase subunit GlcF [Geminicoccaceae bacterium]